MAGPDCWRCLICSTDQHVQLITVSMSRTSDTVGQAKAVQQCKHPHSMLVNDVINMYVYIANNDASGVNEWTEPSMRRISSAVCPLVSEQADPRATGPATNVTLEVNISS